MFQRICQRLSARGLFINQLGKLVNVLVVIALIWVMTGAFAAGAAMVAGRLIGDPLYVIVFAGFLRLGLGIHQNSRRTAAAVE